MKQENKIVRFIVELESDNLPILENQEITVIKKINLDTRLTNIENLIESINKWLKRITMGIVAILLSIGANFIFEYLRFKS